MRKLLALLGIVVAFGLFFALPEEGGQSLLAWMRGEGTPRGAYDPLPPPEPAKTGEKPAEATYEGAVAKLIGPRRLRARLVDARGAPIADRSVLVIGGGTPAPTARSGADGSFELALASETGVLALEDPQWMVLGRDAVGDLLVSAEPMLVAARRSMLAGLVVDDAGAPVPEARLYAYVPLGALAPPEIARQLPVRFEVRGEADSEGRFQLGGLPALAVRVEVQAEGFERWSELLAERGEEPLRVVLRRGDG